MKIEPLEKYKEETQQVMRKITIDEVVDKINEIIREVNHLNREVNYLKEVEE